MNLAFSGHPDKPHLKLIPELGLWIPNPFGSAAVKNLVVVEDDKDVQFLIETAFSLDCRFAFAGVTAAAEDALELARFTEPGIIVLDQGLAGELTGLEAAPRLKDLVPGAKIILFTAHSELREPAGHEAAVDAFLLKTESAQLLQVAQQLTGIGAPSR